MKATFRAFRRIPQLRLVRIGLAFALAFGAARAAFALPTGENVASGQVSVGRPNAQSMVVQQGSASAIVNWNSFSIGGDESVSFRQPSPSSVILNRVVQPNASEIAGRLTANGRVFLVNPSGVLFTRGASVDVGALVASTLDISDGDFLAGRYRFAGAGPGAVMNQGTLQAAERGTIALLGGQVSNEGTVSARLGTVALAAGNKITLDFAGDGLTSIRVDEAAVGAQVGNSGMVIADGGQAILSARAAEALAGTVVNQQGVVRARSLVERNGRIVLDGGESGATLVSGQIDASGPDAGRTGGEIQILGQHVGLVGTAALDASGQAGGGTVLVGGDYQGANPLIRNAAATYLWRATRIDANALGSGPGGKVIVWSDGATRAYGTISARGGARSGDGGFIETSGHQLDTFGIRLDAGANAGASGQWLVDPISVLITNDTQNVVIQGAPPDVIFQPIGAAQTAPSLLNAATLSAALNSSTSVTVSTAGGTYTNGAGQTINEPGDIQVAASISKTQGRDARLRLNAHNDIVVDPGISITSSSGRLNVTFNSDSDASGTGGIWMQPGSEIITNGGNLVFGGGLDPTTGFARGGSNVQAGIYIQGARIDTRGGNISLRGQGGVGFFGEGPVSGGDGVLFDDSTILSGAGSISISGVGGNGAAGQIEGTANGTDGGSGVAVLAGTNLSSSGGAITIRGIGGAGGNGEVDGLGGFAGQGVDQQGLVQSVSGSISINGVGGTGGTGGTGADGGFGGDGINSFGGSIINGSGTVTLIGTAGQAGAGGVAGGQGFNGAGVVLQSGADGGPTITTASGDILVFGRGTNIFENRFVTGLILSGASVVTTAGGNIDLRGRAESPRTGFTTIGAEILNSTVSTAGIPGRILISGETTTDSPGVTIAVAEGDFAATIGGAQTSGNIVIRALNDGGGDAIELGDVIRTSGFVNLRPGGVAPDGSLTAADAVPIYVADPAFAGETALGPFGFVLSSLDLTSIQDGTAGIVIGSSTHTGTISVDLVLPWTDNLTLQNGGAGSAGMAINVPISDPGNQVTLASGGSVAQAAPISAASLLLHGTQPEANFQLGLAGNSVGTLAAIFDVPKSAADPAFGDVNFVNAGPLVIGPLAATEFDSATNLSTTVAAANSTSGGDFFARNLAGNLTLGQSIATLGSDITLVTAGVLVNAAGGALSAANGGVWQVWADTWVGETRGGLNPGNPLPNFYGCSFGAGCLSGITVPAAGNHFIYRQQPAATVIAANEVRPFGLPNPPLRFAVIGLVNGDSAADAAAGTLATTALVSSPVGNYPITGAFGSPVGYILDFVPGTLSIPPNPIPADNAVIEYGQTQVYGRNLGTQQMCLGTGPLLISAAVDNPDRLDREWSRVRQLPNLTNCVEVGERHGCHDF